MPFKIILFLSTIMLHLALFCEAERKDEDMLFNLKSYFNNLESNMNNERHMDPFYQKRVPGWGKRTYGWMKRTPGWGKRATEK